MRQLRFRAMGSDILGALDGEPVATARRLESLPEWFHERESRLSRFLPDSELSRLNRASGRPFPASPVLWDAVGAALEAARWSEGLVTPTVLEALERAGYDRTFEQLAHGEGPESGDAEAAGARRCPDWREVGRDEPTRSLLLPPGVGLDLGGTAKGGAADAAAKWLSEEGPALVDAGGDVAVSGPRRDGRPWAIGVADPLHPERELALLLLEAGGVATSGRDFRRWRQGGRWRHHLIDPRTGQPGRTDVLAATVIAGSALQAEVAAKGVLLRGSREGLAWLESRPELAGLLVLEDGTVLRSRRLGPFLWEEP
jgi:FAD:protein FMN transferase